MKALATRPNKWKTKPRQPTKAFGKHKLYTLQISTIIHICTHTSSTLCRFFAKHLPKKNGFSPTTQKIPRFFSRSWVLWVQPRWVRSVLCKLRWALRITASMTPRGTGAGYIYTYRNFGGWSLGNWICRVEVKLPHCEREECPLDFKEIRIYSTSLNQRRTF